jgi:hypothetical protein
VALWRWFLKQQQPSKLSETVLLTRGAGNERLEVSVELAYGFEALRHRLLHHVVGRQ